MRRRELARYHDLATSTKTRGARIGCAGVGIKLALLVCTEVVTETRRAMALAPLAADPASEHAFVTAFLARWGAALERRRPGRRP